MNLKIKKPIVLYLTLSIMLIFSINSLFLLIDIEDNNSTQNNDNFNLETSQTWNLDPFIISQTGGGNGTWDWAVSQEWCDGSGTQNDPYVIEKVVIDGGGGIGTSGITIIDSNEYFIIQNTTITNTGLLSEDAGIKLLNTTNGVIKNNNLSYNLGNGIYLNNSDHNEIITNEIHNNDRNGIYFYHYNDYNLISENSLYSNGLAGFYHGIYLERHSKYNIISKNKVIDTGGYGIRIYIDCGNTTVIENEVKNSQSGILINEDDCIVTKNIILNNSEYGLLITLSMGSHSSVTDNYFEHNGFTSNGNAIYAIGSNFLTIINNTLIDNYRGIYLKNCQNNILSNNQISDTLDYAINIIDTFGDEPENDIIKNNYIFKCGNGIKLEKWANNIEIINNTIIKQRGYGISIDRYCKNNIVKNNYLLNNGRGILIGDESNYNNITKNIIQGSEYEGLEIYPTAINTTVYQNYFVFNDIQVLNYAGSTMWNYTTLGNYWSNYTGYDLDDDGIGDIPHPIISVANGMDYYPIFKKITPIFIDDYTDYDWEWAAQQFWVNGSGTEEDPYIIQNKIIDKQWQAACIEIRNSEKHFIISDCTLNTNDAIFPGITLYNVKNGEIKNNSITTSHTGLEIYGSSEVNISRNHINYNYIGIDLAHSEKINVSNNNIDHNNIGLSIHQSNNNLFQENSLLNTDSCIIEYESENNTFDGNICDPPPLQKLYMTMTDQLFTVDEFTITFFISNATYHGVEEVSITAYWNGTDVSANITELGSGYYMISLDPIFIAPGESGIDFEASLSKNGFEELSYSSEFSIDPEALQKDETPSTPGGAIPWSTPAILTSTLIAIIGLLLFLRKKQFN
ncbi:MAG: right-handed parallel beta-helix repeat-containing protein [Promethearchaeati archaeon]